jgi:phosphoglycerol transferase
MYVHLTAALVFFAVFWYRLLKWILYQFGGVTSDQILFHVFATTVGTPTSITKKLIFEAGVKPLIGVIIFYALVFTSRKLPRLKQLVVGSGIFLASIVITSAAVKTNDIIFDSRVKNEFKEQYSDFDWMHHFYREPEVSVAPKYNLVWIYFESLESRFVDTENFPTDKNVDFRSSFRSLNGTGWTFAGILATQCGVPVIMDPLSPSRSGHTLKGTICLPDVLSKYGYAGYYTGGAPANFSGKDDFLKPHGIQTILGKEEIQKIIPDAPPSATEYWGYSDDYTLNIIESDVIKLHEKGQKFNYLGLTLDTHGPLIYSKFCEAEGFKNTEKDIYACGLKKINNVIKRWAAAGVLKDTTVVVTGDHPAMRTYHYHWSDFLKKESIARESVFMYVRPADLYSGFSNRMRSTSANHFDLFPTVFYSLGGRFKDDRAGLGVNLLESASISDRFKEEELNYILSRKSESYEIRAGRK